MTVRFPNHELGTRARVIVGGEELLGTLIGQWATGVRVEVETVMQHRMHDRTEANALEAGRLAVIRADVAYALDHPRTGLREELRIARAAALPGMRLWDGGAFYRREAHLEMQIADLARWLEVSR